MATAGYDSTWQAVATAPPSGEAWYYVNVDDGSGFATQSPLNTNNAWPPGNNLLARVARDTTGDAQEPEGAWLDLTGAWVGRSADRFYVSLANNHTSWPTSGGLLKWYAYSLGFSNPEAPSDTWTFALVYVSAWPVMETGLFAVNRYTGDIPERIGNADAQASGNRLHLRCNITDITSDPRFGPWPNTGGWLWAAATTQTITPGGGATKDTTAPGMFYATRTQHLTVNQNRAFALGAARVVPDTGTPETEFSFSIDYTDPDTNPPTRRRMYHLADSFDLAPDNHRYWRGVNFRTALSGFAPGQHYVNLYFSDGAGMSMAPAEFYVTDTVGIAENPGSPRVSQRLPSVVRGVLDLQSAIWNLQSEIILLDASGRRVMTLTPGPNDVRHLSPGVYFVCAPGSRPTRIVLAR